MEDVWSHYTGSEPCDHGRKEGHDVESCEKTAQREASDDHTLRLCEKHYQDVILHLRFGR